MKRTICTKCNFEFTNKGGCYNKHYNSCNGTYKPLKKLLFCKYCDISFDSLYYNNNQKANHIRWCSKNPMRISYIFNLNKTRAAKKNFENQYTKAKKEGREIPVSKTKGKVGHFFGKTHTEKTKQLMREKALLSSHRRLKKGIVEYNGIILDSSWELELAKRLDYLNIKWIRPKPIPWKDLNGVNHNYFPDFYLPLFDLFLDPKNLYVFKLQQEKLKILLSQYNNIRFLTSLKECKNFNITTIGDTILIFETH